MSGGRYGKLRLSHGTVRESSRRVIHALRVHDVVLELDEIDEIGACMRERLANRGEPLAEVVVVQGDAKDSLRLFGAPYSVNRVRAAMFNAAIRWAPVDLDLI